MKDMHYVLENFFTHRDYLVPASQIPGTIFTPLHFMFAAALTALIFSFAVWISHRKERIRPALTAVWAVRVGRIRSSLREIQKAKEKMRAARVAAKIKCSGVKMVPGI